MICLQISCIISLCNTAILWGDNMAGALTVTMYNTADDQRILTKTLSSGVDYSGNIRGTVNLHNPVIDIEGTLTADLNYCKIVVPVDDIPANNQTRYYFCTVENIRTGLSRIYCTLDVLQTFNTAIKNCVVCCKRTYVSQTPYINDSLAPIEQRKLIAYQEPATGNANLCAHSGNYIFITVG